jgi:hypothetical protein
MPEKKNDMYGIPGGPAMTHGSHGRLPSAHAFRGLRIRASLYPWAEENSTSDKPGKFPIDPTHMGSLSRSHQYE